MGGAADGSGRRGPIFTYRGPCGCVRLNHSFSFMKVWDSAKEPESQVNHKTVFSTVSVCLMGQLLLRSVLLPDADASGTTHVCVHVLTHHVMSSIPHD